LIYDYRCKKCGDFEVCQKMTDAPLKKCPTCKKKVERLISGGVHACVKEIKTMGQLAEANNKKYGKEKTALMLEEQKTQKKPAGDNAKRPMELPEGATRKQSKGVKIDYDIVNASPEAKHKYIMEGVRPIPQKSNQNF